MTRTHLTGLHHLSAMSSHAQNTIDFYAGILGLPLLKQTINYDDPGSYHLYFGDPDLQIGTMTFFVWPGAHRGQIGRGGTSHVSFALSSAADLDRWESWLAQHGITTTVESRADGTGILRLEDPDGLRLEFVGPASRFRAEFCPATIPQCASLQQRCHRESARLIEWRSSSPTSSGAHCSTTTCSDSMWLPREDNDLPDLSRSGFQPAQRVCARTRLPSSCCKLTQQHQTFTWAPA